MWPRDTHSIRATEELTTALLRSLYNRNAPGAVADFDAAQFLTRFEIDNGDVVRRAVRGVKLRTAGIERDAPSAISNGNCRRQFVGLYVDDRNGVAAACGDIKLASISGNGGTHRQRAGWQLDFRHYLVRLRVDDSDISAALASDVTTRAVPEKRNRTWAATGLDFRYNALRIGIDREHFSFFLARHI